MAQRFGLTWWGRAWVEALEQRSGTDRARLQRGQGYAAGDRVESIQVDAGTVAASVRGSRRLSYRTHLRVRVFDDADWDRLIEAVAREAGRTAAILDGDLDPDLVEHARDLGLDLLPAPGDLRTSCSCPDHGDPCKHAAAVCYVMAEALDDDPFLLFTLRGRPRGAVLGALRAARTRLGEEAGDGSGAGVLADADAAALARLASGGPEGAGADPGEVARDAWAR